MKAPYLICAFALTITLGYAEERTWTNTGGQTITAELVSYDKEADKVTIRKDNNKDYTLAVSKLSEADQTWLEDWHAAKEEMAEAEAAKLAEMNKNAGKTISLTSDGDLPTAYHVYYPKNFDVSTPHPVLILFSPGGGGKGMLTSVRQGCDSLGWIAIGCDTFKNHGDEEEFDKRFTDLLPHIESNVPHDPEMLYLGGMSGGAVRAYIYSRKFERPWKGVLAYGGWLGEPCEKTAKGMRVAIVNGDNDKNANLYVERDTKFLKRLRCDVEYITFPGAHEIAPPDITEQAMRWIAEKQ